MPHITLFTIGSDPPGTVQRLTVHDVFAADAAPDTMDDSDEKLRISGRRHLMMGDDDGDEP